MGESMEREGIRRRPRQPRDASSPPPSSSSSSCAPALAAPCGRRGPEEEGEEGGGKKQGRRKGKRREAVARAIRERLPAAPSCWGNVSLVQGVGGRPGRSRSRREMLGDRRAGAGDDGCGPEATAAGAPAAAAAAWCCVCPGGDCALEPNPSANGKEDAGLRSLIERNAFYADDCNPHAAAFPATAAPTATAADDDHFD